MQIMLMSLLALHVLSAMFWGGSTAVLARLSGTGGERLMRPQWLAGIVAIASGGYLGHAVHSGGLGPVENMLIAGAVMAGLAFAVQTAFVAKTFRRRGGAATADVAGSAGFVRAQRIAAALLAIAAICMGASRYA
jgi:hypothetical protein